MPRIVEKLNPLNPEEIPEAARYSEASVVFSAFCQLYVIVNETQLLYRNENTGTPPIAFALSKFSKLLNLVDELPECMAERDNPTNTTMMFL